MLTKDGDLDFDVYLDDAYECYNSLIGQYEGVSTIKVGSKYVELNTLRKSIKEMDWCKENCSADPNTPLNKEAHPFLPADRYYNEVMPHINFTLREFRLDEINRLGRKEPNPDLYLWTNLTNFK